MTNEREASLEAALKIAPTTEQPGDAAQGPLPVALRSVELTRDVHGMCIVKVNGREAIRDNGDIIGHMATLDWFAAQPTAQPATQAGAGEMDAEHWAELFRLREAVKGPAGYATWQDAATDERIRRVKAERALATQPPQGAAQAQREKGGA